MHQIKIRLLFLPLEISARPAGKKSGAPDFPPTVQNVEKRYRIFRRTGREGI
jgi:hypothetical protein